MAYFLTVECHPAGINASKDVKHHFFWCFGFYDIYYELGLADSPLHWSRKVRIVTSIQLHQIFKLSQTKESSHISVNGRRSLDSVDDRPFLVFICRYIKNGYRNTQQKRFDKPTLTLVVPNTCHTLEIWSQIYFFMPDTRDNLIDDDVDRADLDLLGIEGPPDLVGILQFAFKTAVLINVYYLPAFSRRGDLAGRGRLAPPLPCRAGGAGT